MFLMSNTGLHIPLPEKGDAIGLFVPSSQAMRSYTDIQNPSRGSVRSRVGIEGPEQPVWRLFDGGRVEFYGTVNQEIVERRTSVQVYLPKDFLPEGYTVFYYIFNDRWVVYGERIISDEGAVDWVYSKFDTADEDLTEFLTGTISDRLVKGAREKICVAAYNCPEHESSMRDFLTSLDIELIDFNTLKPLKVKPVYQHKDFGVFMLVVFFLGVVLLLASLGLYAKSFFQLNEVKGEVAAIQAEIQQLQSQMKLGHIESPEQVIAMVKQVPSVKPSSLIQTVGEVASQFGQLQEVGISYMPYTGEDSGMGEFSGMGITPDQQNMVARASVQSGANELLIDQESVAISLLESHDYIYEITRIPSGTDSFVDLSISLHMAPKEEGQE